MSDTLTPIVDQLRAWALAQLGAVPGAIELVWPDGRRMALAVPIQAAVGSGSRQQEAGGQEEGAAHAPQNLPSATAECQLPLPTAPERRSHAPDFRSILWDGVHYTFTPIQARVVEALWPKDALKPPPEISTDILLRVARPWHKLPPGTSHKRTGERLRDVFRMSRGTRNPAWMKIIIPGERQGTYRLTP